MIARQEEHWDVAKLTALLADRLSAVETDTATAHIEQCDHCRELLDSLAAEPELWSDTRLWLSSEFSEQSLCESPGDFRKNTSDHLATSSESLTNEAPAEPRIPTGLEQISGYQIECEIGRGGMGVVYKAFDEELKRYVAVKVLAPHLATCGAARQRFAREAQAAAAVVHSHIVPIHSVGTQGATEFGDLPYLVMSYVPGESLENRLRREGPLSYVEVLRLGAQIARGLAAAHTQGLVHRDIKPANILVEGNVQRAIITDFGLARTIDEASMTRSGILAGTPQFMSPEQAKGEAIDHRTDLFSLGGVLYALLTGHPPFPSTTTYGTIRRICESGPRALSECREDIPGWLELLVMRLLEKQPEQRFQSAEEVATLLEDCLAHLQRPRKVDLPASLAIVREPASADLVRKAILLIALATATVPWLPRRQPTEKRQPTAASRSEQIHKETTEAASSFDPSSDEMEQAILEIGRATEELSQLIPQEEQW